MNLQPCDQKCADNGGCIKCIEPAGSTHIYIDWKKIGAHQKNRRTGKTFRALLRALIVASNGETVYYLTSKQHLKSFYKQAAVSIAESYLEDGFMDRYPDEIRFKNGGKIKFTVPNDDTFRGIRDPKVVEDD